ncbi:unnamed protein product [Protopolystoma xenopodis]|uniref:Uncharacterized protein n=1 Tax=Protopolystoma xenopodis TaxID=117903 RepID=A0A448WG50_9PLAT|nr:unnamed protein product [Protopolystoma xenopodis]
MKASCPESSSDEVPASRSTCVFLPSRDHFPPGLDTACTHSTKFAKMHGFSATNASTLDCTPNLSHDCPPLPCNPWQRTFACVACRRRHDHVLPLSHFYHFLNSTSTTLLLRSSTSTDPRRVRISANPLAPIRLIKPYHRGMDSQCPYITSELDPLVADPTLSVLNSPYATQSGQRCFSRNSPKYIVIHQVEESLGNSATDPPSDLVTVHPSPRGPSECTFRVYDRLYGPFCTAPCAVPTTSLLMLAPNHNFP